jgi:fatty acid desaturase
MRVKDFTMSGTEEKIRLAIGSAAAAAAIFAPLGYRWKGVLAGVAAGAILTAVYGVSPIRRLLRG